MTVPSLHRSLGLPSIFITLEPIYVTELELDRTTSMSKSVLRLFGGTDAFTNQATTAGLSTSLVLPNNSVFEELKLTVTTVWNTGETGDIYVTPSATFS